MEDAETGFHPIWKLSETGFYPMRVLIRWYINCVRKLSSILINRYQTKIYLQRGKEKLLFALDEDIITVGRASARAPVIPLFLIPGTKYDH